jgi:phospholipase C
MVWFPSIAMITQTFTKASLTFRSVNSQMSRFSLILPHERDFVRQQLAYRDGEATMRGFVETYYNYNLANRVLKPDPMSFFAPPENSVTDFLAHNYRVCDKWFAPLPASTQPNRVMSLSGYSTIDVTRSSFLPDQPLIFDWLQNRVN